MAILFYFLGVRLLGRGAEVEPRQWVQDFLSGCKI